MENNIVKNKKYFCSRISGKKAVGFTAQFHYSGVATSSAKINLGIFNIENNRLVGVLQWGCSYADNIRLDRYIKESIPKDAYLELNRFCMDDTEEKNSESQAISLGLKWLRINAPEIQLLVSYAGRKEGNYGYIYQATNWEYLGYFISNGFWRVDGEERHQITLWNRHIRHGNQDVPFRQDLCDMYSDVRQFESKQFIYVIRLNNKLTLASEALPYPKPSNEYPIVTKESIYKENQDIYNNYSPEKKELKQYYYEENENYLSKRTRLNNYHKEHPKERMQYAQYDINGNLEIISSSVLRLSKDRNCSSIKKAIETGKIYKSKYFREYLLHEKVAEHIDPIPPDFNIYAMYDVYGFLEKSSERLTDFYTDEFLAGGINRAIKDGKVYKDKFFRHFTKEEDYNEQIEVPIICIIDEIPFPRIIDVAKYLNISRQAVSKHKINKSKKINGINIIWVDN